MIRLQDKDTGAYVGDITEDQLQFLISQLEEESEDDREYYINVTTVDSFEEQNADPDLVETLRNALGGREEMEIQWIRQQ